MQCPMLAVLATCTPATYQQLVQPTNRKSSCGSAAVLACIYGWYEAATQAASASCVPAQLALRLVITAHKCSAVCQPSHTCKHTHVYALCCQLAHPQLVRRLVHQRVTSHESAACAVQCAAEETGPTCYCTAWLLFTQPMTDMQGSDQPRQGFTVTAQL